MLLFELYFLECILKQPYQPNQFCCVPSLLVLLYGCYNNVLSMLERQIFVNSYHFLYKPYLVERRAKVGWKSINFIAATCSIQRATRHDTSLPFADCTKTQFSFGLINRTSRVLDVRGEGQKIQLVYTCYKIPELILESFSFFFSTQLRYSAA